MSDNLGSLNGSFKTRVLKGGVARHHPRGVNERGTVTRSPLEQTWTCGKDSNKFA